MSLVNSEFKIIDKCKAFIIILDNYLDNVPRKDMYYKDRLRKESINMIKLIYYINNINSKKVIENKSGELKSTIYIIDFLLERLYIKKYIPDKGLEKIVYKLTEINKMSGVWIGNILRNDC